MLLGLAAKYKARFFMSLRKSRTLSITECGKLGLGIPKHNSAHGYEDEEALFLPVRSSILPGIRGARKGASESRERHGNGSDGVFGGPLVLLRRGDSSTQPSYGEKVCCAEAIPAPNPAN